MGYCRSHLIRSPKKEEQEVPDSEETSNDVDTMDELEGILEIEEDEEKLAAEDLPNKLNWDFMDYAEEGQYIKVENSIEDEEKRLLLSYKRESQSSSSGVGFFDEEDKIVSLNLNLNYQQVLDAWCDRRPLWAAESSSHYMGEVPVMEEETSRRREASMVRYKEKRQSRFFSKKIRYQVRKLNADKRPRLKGRFVKRV